MTTQIVTTPTKRRETIFYHGKRDKLGICFVWRYENHRKRPLRLRLDLENHSPTGFNWGYGGSGPAQLALALLADALGNDMRALRLHQPFKWRIIASINEDEWVISKEQITEVAFGLDQQETGVDNV